MPARLFSRMLRGEISPERAHELWQQREPGQRAFNDELRRRAGVRLEADASAVLAQDSTEGTAPTVRDARTGEYASLDKAAREAGHQPVAGAMVPSERPGPGANEQLRAVYEQMVAQRGDKH
jgi:hypothetical protein